MSHDPQQRPQQARTSEEQDDTPAGRRAMLATGVAAGVGALGLLTSGRAEAATIPPLYLSRLNNAAAGVTQLYSTGSSSFVIRHGGGSGQALLVTGEKAGHGAFLRCVNRDRWGAVAYNLAPTTGRAGALLAQGGHNIGARVDTAAADVPALVTTGAAGAGVAFLATGEAYLDGDAMALRSWVGIPTTVAHQLGYAPLDSSVTGSHSATGKVTLDGSGNATVTFDPAFAVAVQRADPDATPAQPDTLTVQLTAVGGAMPNLHVAAVSDDGFTIAGGTASGSVFWQAVGDRVWLQFDDAPAVSGGKAAAARSSRSGAARPTVRTRRQLAGGVA